MLTNPPRLTRSYEDDVNLSINLNWWTLKPIGTWPRSSKNSWSELLLCRTLNIICYGLLAFILIPCSMYIVLEIKDFYNQLKLGSALSFFMMAVMKYCALIIREDGIRTCVGYIKTDWMKITRSEDRRIMLENANFGRKLIVICGAFMYGGVIFYYIAIPLTRAKIVEEDGNLTYRRLVYPFPKIIVDARRSPMNEIFYIIQLLSGFVAHNITVAACGVAALLVMHACGQLQILMHWLEHLVDGHEDDESTVDERLANIIEQHVRVLRTIVARDIAGRNCGLHVKYLFSWILLYDGMYFDVGKHMEWDFKQPVSGLTYLLLLVSVTFNIFIFCYIGELLAEQTVKVGERSYMIDWYRLPGKKSLAVILMIMMSNSSTKMTAGNLIELSITSFGDVIKTSVAYLNMLRTFTT